MNTTANFERLIDNEELIHEVKEYPCLYDLLHPDYKSKIRNPKNHAWQNIAKKIFENRWGEMHPYEKEQSCKAIQKRWKGLRDALTRSLRLGSREDRDVKKKPYVYSKQMGFLLPYLNTSLESQGIEEITVNTSNALQGHDEDQEFAEPSGGREKESPTILHYYTENSDEQNFDYEYANVHSPMEVSEDYNDGDKMFMLSILPYFKKLKPAVKLDIKIQFMQIIRSHMDSD